MEFPQEIFFPQKTIFRKGSFLEIPKEVLEFGRRGVIVHGSSFSQSGKEELLKLFPGKSKISFFCRSKGEPVLEEIVTVIETAKSIDSEWIVGIGGGSVLDLAKSAAGLYNAQETPEFYQEGGNLKKKGIPFVAVPTTAGTGSEATINAVIINKRKGVKVSIRDTSFIARTVILDVNLLSSMPRTVLSYSAMDAYIQAYESFISNKASWFSETLALKSMELINKSILSAYKNNSEEDLSSLLLGSYLGGMAFSSSRLGVIHGIAHPLGALYGFAHGLICSACFPASIKINKDAMGEKYELISKKVGDDFLRRAEYLLSELVISSPFKNRQLKEKEKIIEQSLKSGSTVANPKNIKREDLEYILDEIF